MSELSWSIPNMAAVVETTSEEWQREEPVLGQEKEWYIPAPWGRICIVAWGNCLDPPILVCHGELDCAASFKPIMKYLPASYYYVAVEFPGQGRSDPYPPGLGIAIWDLVYVIEHVRRHFRWPEFGYMAHSMGCVVGRLYNITHPERMTQVVEFDPMKLGFPTEMEKFSVWYNKNFTKYFEKYQKMNAPRDKGPTYTWDEAIQKVSNTRGIDAETARDCIERWSQPVGKDRIRFTYDQRTKGYIVPPFTPELVKSLYGSLTTPTLAILAQESIDWGFFKLTPSMLKDTSTYRIRVVSGSHNVHIAHPDRMALFVCQFLKYGLEGVKKDNMVAKL